MVDAYDDLATAREPFKVVACIPVFGRGPLVEQTIKRLYNKNGVYRVICAGSEPEDRQICEKTGAIWIQHRNQPLGAKWNAAFKEAKKYNPDACLFVGSSDWLSDNWLPVMIPYLSNYDLIGVPGCHFLHLCDEPLLCHWKGYTNGRDGESIGIGRLLSRQLLERIHYEPFKPELNNSLDSSMQQTCSRHAARIHLVDSHKIKAVSISTNEWANKHQFSDHYLGRLPSEKIKDVDNFIQSYFPEAKTVCESLKGTSQSL